MAAGLYRNRWMPQSALDALAGTTGPILDVGGGAAPFARADHIVDIQPFDAQRLERNIWGGETKKWESANYTSMDICVPGRWPFADNSFALGLCSHTMEDLRDPIPVLAELGRVCEKLLIITPSRLLEQTRGIDHPRYCGFSHHPWIAYAGKGEIVFRRKTVYLNFPGAHFWCPFGKTLSVDDGTFVYHGPAIRGREEAYWSGEEDLADYQRFVSERKSTFSSRLVNEDRPGTLGRRVYRFKQSVLGVP